MKNLDPLRDKLDQIAVNYYSYYEKTANKEWTPEQFKDYSTMALAELMHTRSMVALGESLVPKFSEHLSKQSDSWLPACGGTEAPFVSRSGKRLQYVWQPSTGKHAYLDLDSDIILSNEEAEVALALY